MKYIRTKAGKIYDLINLHVEEKLNGNPYVETSSGWVIYKTSIIKSADTIEELCDEFVGIDSQGHYIIHNDKFIDGARIVPLEKVKYYGAIWTDKGLQFVARMNSEGVLELLWD